MSLSFSRRQFLRLRALVASAEIAYLTPDEVIVEEDQLEATDAMLRALRVQSASWRVVALRLDETAMHVWSGACQPITRVEDFTHALVCSGPSKSPV